MAAADQAVHRCEESQRAYDHLSMATSTSCTCTSAGSDQSTGVEFDFSAALLSHHLDNIDDESSGNRDGGEVKLSTRERNPPLCIDPNTWRPMRETSPLSSPFFSWLV